MQGTEFSLMEWKSINFMKKLLQIQTDIIFLSKCKQMDIIPKGLKVKNPLQSTYHTDYADSLCHTLSKKLRNHLINILYNKQGKIKNELSKLDTHKVPQVHLFFLENVKSLHWSGVTGFNWDKNMDLSLGGFSSYGHLKRFVSKSTSEMDECKTIHIWMAPTEAEDIDFGKQMLCTGEYISTGP
ncbi:hypothetical protein UY3_18607 [Chelonia mydas]|uniref:Uncharacterized protein n=1 Tax=Chelonia mydas TaxID=8469 RepID=M7AJ40_CHEMY|nr:hypothetical protein UY3_18607 [Chelonia mydas]